MWVLCWMDAVFMIDGCAGYGKKPGAIRLAVRFRGLLLPSSGLGEEPLRSLFAPKSGKRVEGRPVRFLYILERGT